MIFTKLERKIAFRYMRAKKRGFGSVISWVSLVGIALGVMTLVIVMSVMTGFHNVLLNRIIGMNGHIVIYHQDGAIRDYDFLIERIKSHQNIMTSTTSIVPIVEGQVMASANGRNSGAMMRGIRLSDLDKKVENGMKIYGEAVTRLNSGDIVIGNSLARNLRISLGDMVNLIAANGGTITAFGTMPRMVHYRAVSTFFMGMYEYDNAYIFMPFADAQRYLGIPGAATHVDLFLKNPEATESVKRQLIEVLPNGFIVRDWKELNKGFVGALEVESNVMFLILMMIVIVAAFNIVSSLFMLVQDKNKDIAVLRTFGVTRKSIMKIFVLSGVAIGIIGTIAGAISGVVVAFYVEDIRQIIQVMTGRNLFPPEMYFLSELPSVISPIEVFGIGMTAIGLSFLATLYPAWKASKTDPVEVLRYE